MMDTPRKGNLRAYLAGTGATGALIAGAVIAFLTVAAIVAFDGSLFGDDDGAGSASLAGQPGGLAPESAAVALAPAPDAVAATPAGGEVLAAVLPGAGGPGAGGAVSGGGPGGTQGPGPGPGPTPPGPGGGGPVGDVVNDLDETTGGLGLDLDLGDQTSGVTEPLDQTLNDVGGALGQPNLGNRVNDTVRGLSSGLLGGN